MSKEEHIARMRGLSEDHEPEGWPAVRMRELTLLCDIAESAVPAIDRLEDRLRQGATIQPDGIGWRLVAQGGEVIVAGKTLRGMMINLIFLDC